VLCSMYILNLSMEQGIHILKSLALLVCHFLSVFFVIFCFNQYILSAAHYWLPDYRSVYWSCFLLLTDQARSSWYCLCCSAGSQHQKKNK
jgi:hypothetical protein